MTYASFLYVTHEKMMRHESFAHGVHKCLKSLIISSVAEKVVSLQIEKYNRLLYVISRN